MGNCVLGWDLLAQFAQFCTILNKLVILSAKLYFFRQSWDLLEMHVTICTIGCICVQSCLCVEKRVQIWEKLYYLRKIAGTWLFFCTNLGKVVQFCTMLGKLLLASFDDLHRVNFANFEHGECK